MIFLCKEGPNESSFCLNNCFLCACISFQSPWKDRRSFPNQVTSLDFLTYPAQGCRRARVYSSCHKPIQGQTGQTVTFGHRANTQGNRQPLLHPHLQQIQKEQYEPWKDSGEPSENPCKHRKKIQTPHRNASDEVLMKNLVCLLNTASTCCPRPLQVYVIVILLTCFNNLVFSSLYFLQNIVQINCERLLHKLIIRLIIGNPKPPKASKILQLSRHKFFPIMPNSTLLKQH